VDDGFRFLRVIGGGDAAGRDAFHRLAISAGAIDEVHT